MGMVMGYNFYQNKDASPRTPPLSCGAIKMRYSFKSHNKIFRIYMVCLLGVALLTMFPSRQGHAIDTVKADALHPSSITKVVSQPQNFSPEIKAAPAPLLARAPAGSCDALLQGRSDDNTASYLNAVATRTATPVALGLYVAVHGALKPASSEAPALPKLAINSTPSKAHFIAAYRACKDAQNLKQARLR